MDFQGFVGPSYATRSTQQSAEELINGYLETQESPNATPRRALLGVPGLSAPLMILGDVPTRGQFLQDSRAFAVGGGNVYETTTGIPILIGTVVNDLLPVKMVSNGQAGHQLMILSAGLLYCFDLVSNAFTLVTGTSSLIAGPLMGLDYFTSFFVVCNATTIQVSASFNGLNWNGAATGQREFGTDNIVSLIALPPTLWVLGTVTTEPWYNNGVSVFPLGPIPSVFVDYGLAAQNSITRFDNSVIWLAKNRYGQRIVVEASAQYIPLRVSTHAVEASLNACTSVTDFTGYSYQEEGHTFFVLTSPANQLTFVYDAGEKTWHRRAYKNPVNGNWDAQLVWNHIPAFGGHWVGDRRNGNIYQQSLNLFSDNGDPLVFLRRFPHMVKEQQRIYYPGLQIDCQMGVGLQTGQGSDPQLMLRWSDDGGETYSNTYGRSLGKAGKYSQRAIWRRLGRGRNRVFELSISDPVQRTILGAYFNPPPLIGTS